MFIGACVLRPQEIALGTLRHALLGALTHPPAGFERLALAHVGEVRWASNYTADYAADYAADYDTAGCTASYTANQRSPPPPPRPSRGTRAAHERHTLHTLDGTHTSGTHC